MFDSEWSSSKVASDRLQTNAPLQRTEGIIAFSQMEAHTDVDRLRKSNTAQTHPCGTMFAC
jgi:hypothetical protein